MLLECEQLTMCYPCGTPALRGVDLTLAAGQRLAVIGANGAGKSTLLSALVGLVDVQGRVLVNGVPLTKETAAQARRTLGFVFQNPDDQLFSPTVEADVAFGPQCAGTPPAEALAQARAMLETLGIAHLAGKAPYKMSGGEKRMAALAGVLVLHPQALLLDEPTAFLDPRARRTLAKALCARSEAMLLATHDLDFALDVCSDVVILRAGAVAARGPAAQLLRDEALLESAGLELPLSLQRR